MRKLKKMILGCMLLGCVALAGVGATQLQNTTTAQAAVATEYTTVDTEMFVKFSNESVADGKFNISIVLPEYDYTGTANGYYSFGEWELAEVFQEFGFFENIMIGEKTLKEWGCESFYHNTIGYGDGEPQNQMIFRCYADPTIWKAAIDSGEIVIPTYTNGQMSDGSTVTVKEGTLIPGFSYLSGSTNAVVYRAKHTAVAKAGQMSYSWATYAQTDVDSIQYTTGWDENYNNAYLGVSLIGDDYFGNDGTEELLNDASKYAFSSNQKFFINSILVNGETGKVDFYGLFNLTEKGKGYYSFVIKVKPSDCTSITIPKGTLFPTKAINDLRKVNAAFAYILYETQEDKTFYLSADGNFMTYEQYVKAELDAYKAEEGYFRTAEAAERATIVADAKTAIDTAASQTEMESIVAAAKTAIDALKTAAQYADEELAKDKAAARETIDNYKKEEAYLEEQAAERDAAIETGLVAVSAAKNVEEINAAVEAVKTAIDGLQTKEEIVAAAKAELDDYKAEEGYFREEQAAERATAITMAKATIDSATKQSEIDGAVTTAKAAIDELLSAEEWANGVLEGKRKEAFDTINEKKASVIFDNYTAENQAAINELYRVAHKEIEEATDAETMDSAAKRFVAEIDKVAKVKKESGCQSNIGNISVAIATVCALGVAVVCKKKENEIA